MGLGHVPHLTVELSAANEGRAPGPVKAASRREGGGDSQPLPGLIARSHTQPYVGRVIHTNLCFDAKEAWANRERTRKKAIANRWGVRQPPE
jgi:hypothetical protein